MCVLLVNASSPSADLVVRGEDIAGQARLSKEVDSRRSGQRHRRQHNVSCPDMGQPGLGVKIHQSPLKPLSPRVSAKLEAQPMGVNDS